MLRRLMIKPRVLLADDHTLVLEGFRKLLEKDFDLVGTADNGRALVSEAERLKPQVILLDISMPLLNGLDAARQIKKVTPDVKLVFVTVHADAAYVREAFRAGASAYVLKRSAASELVKAVREVIEGRAYVTPLVAKDVIKGVINGGSEDDRTDPLTGRQREVLQLVAEGHSGKEIAHLLNISTKTVEFHKASIMKALVLHSTAELTKYAMEHGLTGP